MLFDAKCPYCGTWNCKLYLEETDGTMECQCCNKVSRNDYVHMDDKHVRLTSSFHGGSKFNPVRLQYRTVDITLAKRRILLNDASEFVGNISNVLL